MPPSNADLEKRMEKYEEAQGRQGDILVKLTAIIEAFTGRISSIEADAKTTQTTLIEMGKTMVRFEERDASTQKWVAVVVSLVIGIIMFGLGYFLHR